MKKQNSLPSIVITGASGFIGRYILDNVKDKFTVFAIARRSRKAANIPYHKNVNWIQCDISNGGSLSEVEKYIVEYGGADYLIHLAAFYDFTYTDNQEYHLTNVEGTRNILEFAKSIKVKRFIFASSLAACNFPTTNCVITEETPLDADYAYARTKKIGEQLVKEYSNYFACSIVRLAAVYSDWCEYAPLYKFLSTWLSNRIDSKILAGLGESAIPYIHIKDVSSLIQIIISKSENLGQFEIFNASPDGSVSHKELFKIATIYFFGNNIKPIFLPKILAYPGLVLKRLLQHTRLVCEIPFEKFWMIKYIDKKLNVDSSNTRKILEWEPEPRYHISRRLLFLLEKLKSHPDEWRYKNEAALIRVAKRNNLIIYEALAERKDAILPLMISEMRTSANDSIFGRYKKLDPEDFQCYISTLYHLLMATVRNGDRSLMIKYIDDIAIRRFAEGFQPIEICETLSLFNKIITRELIANKDLMRRTQVVYDYIGMTWQLAQDEVYDLYDSLRKKMPIENISESSLLPDCKGLQKTIRQLSAFYQISPENGTSYKESQ